MRGSSSPQAPKPPSLHALRRLKSAARQPPAHAGGSLVARIGVFSHFGAEAPGASRSSPFPRTDVRGSSSPQASKPPAAEAAGSPVVRINAFSRTGAEAPPQDPRPTTQDLRSGSSDATAHGASRKPTLCLILPPARAAFPASSGQTPPATAAGTPRRRCRRGNARSPLGPAVPSSPPPGRG